MDASDQGWFFQRDLIENIQQLLGPRPHSWAKEKPLHGKPLSQEIFGRPLLETGTVRPRKRLLNAGIIEQQKFKKIDERKRETFRIGIRLRQDKKGFRKVYLAVLKNNLLSQFRESYYQTLIEQQEAFYIQEFQKSMSAWGDGERFSAVAKTMIKYRPELFTSFLEHYPPQAARFKQLHNSLKKNLTIVEEAMFINAANAYFTTFEKSIKREALSKELQEALESQLAHLLKARKPGNFGYSYGPSGMQSFSIQDLGQTPAKYKKSRKDYDYNQRRK
jgi:hypothetical protein